MKEQIVDTITKELPITGNFAQQRKIVERLADEILDLYREGMNCEECDWREVFEKERLLASMVNEEDLANADLIQSIGDEVI